MPLVEVQGNEHVVSYVNSAFCSLLGKARGELLGKSFAQVVPGAEGWAPLLDQVYQTGQAVTQAIEDEAAAPFGGWLYAMWPALDPNERPMGVIIQMARVANFQRDVTAINEALLIAGLRQHELTDAAENLNAQLQREIAERKRAQEASRQAAEQAERAAHARDDLLAIVSHDLKNPLSIILLQIDMMAKAGGDDRRRSKTNLQAIQRAARRMDHLIQDLLDTASIEAGKLSVEPRPLEVAPLVAEVLDAMKPLAASKGLQLDNKIPTDLPEVLADAARLQQVFTNLLGNAIKFTPPGGTITIRAEATAETVQFSVADTGPGIAAEDLPHLFDRFWQAQRTARMGTGLGLAIVQGIVVAHGGRIWAESKVGAGSAFFFTLPVA
jgi:signal transduction histidine kinase